MLAQFSFSSLDFSILSLVLQLILVFYLSYRQNRLHALMQTRFDNEEQGLIGKLHQLQLELQQLLQTNQQSTQDLISQAQIKLQQLIAEAIQLQMRDVREQMSHSFTQHATALTTQLQTLTEEIRHYLQSLTKQVQTQLMEGFEKTSSTFTDVVRRLTIIDEAQKKITELSTSVVSLQDVLVDKRSRGVFGEVQLSNLIANVMPSSHYRLQHTLSNQKRADCILFLPPPTGNLVIDAKFPLETYQKIVNTDSSLEKKTLQQQFRQDLQKHIKDIAEKYIIPQETADGAIMFIPAEAIFSEIHANYPEIVSLSQRLKVWLVSPSTLMAVLTTATAVLKDDETRKHVHIIQKHLQALANDFQRFEKRMDKLSKHIGLAYQDVTEVNTSAQKITQRFQKIESVELDSPEATPQMAVLQDETV